MTQQTDNPTPEQAEAQSGVPDTQHDPTLETRPKGQPRDLIGAYRHPWQDEPATKQQRRLLASHKLWRDGMTKGEADEEINAMLERFARQKAGGKKGAHDPSVLTHQDNKQSVKGAAAADPKS